MEAGVDRSGSLGVVDCRKFFEGPWIRCGLVVGAEGLVKARVRKGDNGGVNGKEV